MARTASRCPVFDGLDMTPTASQMDAEVPSHAMRADMAVVNCVDMCSASVVRFHGPFGLLPGTATRGSGTPLGLAGSTLTHDDDSVCETNADQGGGHRIWH